MAKPAQKQAQVQEPNAKQKAAVARITRIDPEATFEVISGWVKATYIPAWERSYNDRPVPNPQRIVFALDESGRIHGWGFTSAANFPALIKRCPFGADLTTPEQMKDVQKARQELRTPKPEPKAAKTTTPEPEAEAKPKATTKRTRKTGVRVTTA